MAEETQGIPQFKLVLVGDGGTGKVSDIAWTLPHDFSQSLQTLYPKSPDGVFLPSFRLPLKLSPTSH